MTPSSTSSKSTGRTTWSAPRIAYLVHSAAGLWFTILLTVVMVTGTLAVFAPEVDRLVFPQLRSAPPDADAERLNPGTLYDAVAGAYPGMGITQITTSAHDPWASATTTVMLPGGNKRNVAINPYTGKITGEVPAMTVRGFLAPLHAVLFSGLPGFCVVNFCGLLVLAALVSGLIAYRKFWRGFFTRPRFGRGGRILLGDLHRLLGVWTLGFLLVMGLTGSWYFYNYPLAYLGAVPDVLGAQPEAPMLAEADLDALGPGTPRPLSGAAVVQAALAAHPDMIVTGLMPPMNQNMPFVVYGERGEYLHGRSPNAIYVNPFTGAVMGAHLSEDLHLTQFLFEAMSQLHHGELLPPRWGNGPRLAMKTVWFLCGAGASFLCVSGVLLFLRRTRKALPESMWRRVWNWVKPWGGPMSVFKYVNVLVILALVAGVARIPRMIGPKPHQPVLALPARMAGPYEVSLDIAVGAEGAMRPGARVTVHPRMADGGFADARMILVGLESASASNAGAGAGAGAGGVRIKGPEHLAMASLRLPGQLEGVALWVEIRRWDGTAHRASWIIKSGESGAPVSPGAPASNDAPS